MPKATVKEALEKSGLPPTIRAEKMTMKDFAVLSEILRGGNL
jgi:16S rRNA A1518/A1519 N6-dimethyltransferase RsmA/KsgA/DIM1 with predicted DNA glycosylase/AP lyase activity